MCRTETQTLVETLELQRDLTRYYLKNLEGQDVYKIFEVEGEQLNSIIWLLAHITVSENWLLLVCTGGEKVDIPWARQFGLGSEIPKEEDCPPFEEVLDYFKQVHEKCISYVSQLSDDDLGKPTTNGIDFGGEDSLRAIIKHSIRHEGAHCGHLGWLCKLFGVKTI